MVQNNEIKQFKPKITIILPLFTGDCYMKCKFPFAIEREIVLANAKFIKISSGMKKFKTKC